MKDKMEKLSPELVQRLLTDPSTETRIEAASTVAQNFDAALGEAERTLAEDIFRTMIHDAEERVRLALSESLKDNDLLPHDIALSLAQDVGAVAEPLLQSSNVLNDDELIEIVHQQTANHRRAIASRRFVSRSVSDAVIDSGDDEAVATLVENDGAEISDGGLEKVVDIYGQQGRINSGLVRRTHLPLTVSERLVTLVSERMRSELVSRHELPDDIAADLVLEARESATIGLLENGVDRMDTLHLVQQLHANNRLTPTMILRAACVGDMNFVELAFAEICKLKVSNVYHLLHRSGEIGTRALIEEAGFSGDMALIMATAMAVAAEAEYNGLDHDRERFAAKVIERVLTTVEDRIDNNNLEYFLDKLRRFGAARTAA
jgi:uncharacterized protein (DUF2336 family)